MSRFRARESSLQALFQLDLNFDADENPAVEYALEEKKLSKKNRAYTGSLVRGVRTNIETIDRMIADVSHEWKIDRMATIDRNIVRLAVYEMLFAEERLSAGIAINEAVELAKIYGTDDSARFINGILGAIARKNNV